MAFRVVVGVPAAASTRMTGVSGILFRRDEHIVRGHPTKQLTPPTEMHLKPPRSPIKLIVSFQSMWSRLADLVFSK